MVVRPGVWYFPLYCALATQKHRPPDITHAHTFICPRSTQTTLEMLGVLGASEMRIASVADQLSSPPSDCLTDVEMDLTESPLEMAGDLPITFAVRDDLLWTGPFLDVCVPSCQTCIQPGSVQLTSAFSSTTYHLPR